MRWFSVISLAFILAGCSSVQPLPVKSGDICYRCREPILEVRLATEFIDATGGAYKFKCPGCITKYLAEHPDERPKGVFVTDFPSGKMLRADSAVYVRFKVDGNRGEVDYAAFRDRKDAAAFAAERKADPPIDWAGVSKAVTGS
jgi:hypothetical protein